MWARFQSLAALILSPRQFTQIVLAVVLLAVAHLLALWLEPKLQAWTRNREGWAKWRLRWMVVIRQRLRLILFVILSWIAVVVVRQIIVWPSARYILTLVASIATAWLIVALATRLIRNRFMQRLVSWGAWIWVTLYYVGLLDETYQLLDTLALEFGEFRLSVLLLLQALVATGVLLTLARLITQTTSTRVRQNEDLSPSMQVLVVKVLQLVLYGAAFFIGLKAVGFDLTGLAVLSGAIGVGLGFGLQKVVSNLVSGIIILLDKSIKPGDVISLGETFGWINSLGARYVSITTRDGKEYLIPNEDLITGQVVNWSHSNDFVRLDIHFGTAYHNDPHKVRAIAIEAASSVSRVLDDRRPVCHIVGFGDSSVDYILRFWISDPTGGLTNIRGAVFLALWDAFEAAGISIPFPQREIRMLDEAGMDQSTGTASKMSPG
nr:mechanosensitive ion channel domain-containing protein [Actibacterium sp. 188UL27-1]